MACAVIGASWIYPAMLVFRMHLSLLIAMVSLGVATVSYLRASRVERDHRHLRRGVRELRLQIRAQTRAEDQNQRTDERIASAEPKDAWHTDDPGHH
jgi:hypothetical protein